jgi:low affinity Fe/Cu permease
VREKNWRTAGDNTPPPRNLFCRIQDAFRVFARGASAVLGTAWVFVGAITIIAVWAATGHFYNYSDTWQLLINTGTTIVTFLMVFLIQNTQNRDSKAVHLKLDELIRAIDSARNHLVNVDRLSDDELKTLEQQFKRISKKADETLGRVEDVVAEVEDAAEAAEAASR